MPLEKLHHIIPFMALMARPMDPPPNRPMLTRIVEQSIVGVIGGGFGAYVVLAVATARVEERVTALYHSDANIAAELLRVEERALERDRALQKGVDKNETKLDRVSSELNSVRLKIR